MSRRIDGQPLPADAIAALQKGSKIAAIKSVRLAHGVGLKDAKEIVEQFIENNPAIRARINAANMEDAKRSFGWIAAIVAIGLAAYYFLAGK